MAGVGAREGAEVFSLAGLVGAPRAVRTCRARTLELWLCHLFSVKNQPSETRVSRKEPSLVGPWEAPGKASGRPRSRRKGARAAREPREAATRAPGQQALAGAPRPLMPSPQQERSGWRCWMPSPPVASPSLMSPSLWIAATRP